MTPGHPHPADEKALADLFAKFIEVMMRTGRGRKAELVGVRDRSTGRITGYVVEHHFPTDAENA